MSSKHTNIHTMRKRYVPNLRHFMVLCERNYVSVLRLLPEVEPQGYSSNFSVNELLAYKIEVKEVCKYTTTVECSQLENGLPEYLRPVMLVRLYHDARVAEVISSQNIARLKGRYDYPNKDMHQQDEKLMTNLFLKEWLSFCLSAGRADIAVNL